MPFSPDSNQPRTRLTETALQTRLTDAEQTLDAIRSGDIDALVVQKHGARQVLTVEDTEPFYRMLVDEIPIGLASIDRGGMILYANAVLARMLGEPPARLVGASLTDFVPEEQRTAAASTLADGAPGLVREIGQLRNAAGEMVPVRACLGRLPGAGEGVSCLTVADISDVERAQRELVGVEERYRQIVETAYEGIWTVDRDGVVTFVNRALAQMLGNTPQEMLGRSGSEFIHTSAGERAAELFRPLSVAGGTREELPLRRKDGMIVPVLVSWASLSGPGGSTVGLLGMITDITARKRAEAERARLAAIVESSGEAILSLATDGVIETWNRGAERLYGHTAAEAVGQDAVMLLAGDPTARLALLAKVASGDHLAEIQGRDVRKDGSMVDVAITDSPIHDPDGRVIGIARVARDITLRVADQRRMRNKLDELTWVGRIRDALDEDRFALYAQPIVDVHTVEPVRHELLLRMLDRDGNVILPGRFLAAAELHGLIVEIDQWVVSQAALLVRVGHRVAFKISASSVTRSGSAAAIHAAFKEVGADPRNAVCEITETALVTSKGVAEAFVRELDVLGFEVALENFGSGYAGLTYLKRLPVSLLKISIELISDLAENPKHQHLVRAIVSLAKGFEKKTIAVGVEDERTLKLLEELGVDYAAGVDYAQGYAIGHPVPIAEAFALGAQDHEQRR